MHLSLPWHFSLIALVLLDILFYFISSHFILLLELKQIPHIVDFNTLYENKGIDPYRNTYNACKTFCNKILAHLKPIFDKEMVSQLNI